MNNRLLVAVGFVEFGGEFFHFQLMEKLVEVAGGKANALIS